MSQQQFVYAEFVKPSDASLAVNALVDGDFEPDEIDVLCVRGEHVERMPIQHHRPVLAGAAVGTAIGMIVGIAAGLIASTAPLASAWSEAAKFMLSGAATGFLAGGLAGMGWWRSKLRITGAQSNARRYVVGTVVPDSRGGDVEGILGALAPLKTGRYPVSGSDAFRQHVQRVIVPAP